MLNINYFYTDIKWKIFYIFFSFLFTFIMCVDSWEYILNFEIDSIKNLKNVSTNQSFVFTKVTEGQSLIYLVSVFYAIIFTLNVVVIYFSLFLIPALYKEEILNNLLTLITLWFLFLFIYIINHYIIFPILCKDLLQYKYSNLNDFVMNLRVEPLLSILDFIQMKFKILTVLYCLNLFWYILFWFGKRQSNLIKLLINYRFIILFLIIFTILFFFEAEIYVAFYMIALNWIFLESILFLIFLYEKYKKILKRV